MDTTIFTPRLKLTLVTTAERGSQELEWFHELRSDEQVTWWSIYGQSKSLEDTEKAIKGVLPLPSVEGEEKTYRVVYAVHELIPSTSESGLDNKEDIPSRFIGSVTLRSVGPNDLPLPPHLFPTSSMPSSKALTLELGYSYLPAAWGKGYGTESVNAVFDACKRAPSFWAPFEKVYVRAIVNAENPASQRVMAKTAMTDLGVYVWEGKAVWLAGKWTEKSDLHIYGTFLKE